jgi:hypothetical protein
LSEMMSKNWVTMFSSFRLLPWAQCYKTFYVRNLIFYELAVNDLDP